MPGSSLTKSIGQGLCIFAIPAGAGYGVYEIIHKPQNIQNQIAKDIENLHETPFNLNFKIHWEWLTKKGEIPKFESTKGWQEIKNSNKLGGRNWYEANVGPIPDQEALYQQEYDSKEEKGLPNIARDGGYIPIKYKQGLQKLEIEVTHPHNAAAIKEHIKTSVDENGKLRYPNLQKVDFLRNDLFSQLSNPNKTHEENFKEITELLSTLRDEVKARLDNGTLIASKP